ncbi:hypothetical protein EZ456_07550 [Pedobacter psychrodurus]|uniref:CBU-0592-like domain-containing protein n=1 Tax=Pedobacter psychrodurus TaxID=2530456 RepID=A0A4R0PXW5_9SPHI|nr:hypothetical protein EZ456_07550 [Pedobacter psychrodurus]
MTLINIIGWLGAILYIIAYFLLTIHAISSSSFAYHFLNVLGAIGLTINACYLKDSPNIIVNLVWLLIAISAISNLYRNRPEQKH